MKKSNVRRSSLLIIAALTTACASEVAEGGVTIEGIGADGTPFHLQTEPAGPEESASRSEALTDGDEPFVLPELPSAGTEPWEPGNGYFERDRDDPENRIYYSSCGESDGEPVTSGFVERVLVNSEDQSLVWSVVLVDNAFSQPIIDASTGLPFDEGDTINETHCEYTSSYAECEIERPLIDFTQFPPPIAADARIVNRGTQRMYWDYGQNRFRVLFGSTTRCEGTECDAPFVQLVSDVPEGGCESYSMGVYTRVAP
ncbi:MAG: hypothetical protein AB8I08_13780 [Sandaracinaceae bacterium]